MLDSFLGIGTWNFPMETQEFFLNFHEILSQVRNTKMFILLCNNVTIGFLSLVAAVKLFLNLSTDFIHLCTLKLFYDVFFLKIDDRETKKKILSTEQWGFKL